jgi:N-methylhydantoinase B
MGALARAIPDRVAADGSGGSTIPSIGGVHEGKTFIFVETQMGVSGGTLDHDGQEGVAHLGANQSNVPIEIIEADYPLRIERYAFVDDTGGPGRSRGGLAIVREFRLLAESASLTVRSDKRRFPPFGLAGGMSGSASSNVVNPGSGDEHELPVLTMDPHRLKRGDLYRHVMASGGGYGDCLQRDPARVCRDVLLGKVSVAQARDVYGVVIVGDSAKPNVDTAATNALREQLGKRVARSPLAAASL